MPKRRSEDSDDYLLKKIRRLERKIRRRQRQESPTPTRSSPSLSAEGSASPTIRLLVDQPSTPDHSPEISEPLVVENTSDLPQDILKVLGENYEKPQEMGDKIHTEIADRWNTILKNGLEKTEKENILKKNFFLIPENCTHLVVPKMNPETAAACSDQNKRRDFLIETRQKMIAAGISGLAYATDKVLTLVEPAELKISLLELLNNTGKILSDTFYNETKTRRSLIVSGLEKEVRDTLLESKPDSFLFGENLYEKIKTAKSMGKTGREMRIQHKPNKTNSQRNLNWKGPPRQTQRHTPQEPRANKYRSSGPRQAPPKRAPPAASRGYRKQSYSSSQQPHRN